MAPFTSQRRMVCLAKPQKRERREEALLFTRKLRQFGKTWGNPGKKAAKNIYLKVFCPKRHGVEATAEGKS